MKAYSEDLRERIVAGRKHGRSSAELAQLFNVSKRTVERYWKQHQSTGTISPRRMGGYGRSRLAEYDDCLLGWIKADNSITLEQMRQRLQKQCGVKVGNTALWHRLKGLKLSYKKNSKSRRARSC